MEVLRRDFLIDHLRIATAEAGITGTIVVERNEPLQTEGLSRSRHQVNLSAELWDGHHLQRPELYQNLKKLPVFPR